MTGGPRRRAQVFILLALVMLVVNTATDLKVFFYLAAGLLAVVIISDWAYGK